MDPNTLHMYEDRNVSLVLCCLLREYCPHVMKFCGDVSFIINDSHLLECDTVLLASYCKVLGAVLHGLVTGQCSSPSLYI
jgi:hypothetical protein